MKVDSQCLRKISFILLFLTQGALLAVLTYQFNNRTIPIPIENSEDELFYDYDYNEDEYDEIWSLEDLIKQEKQKETWLSSKQAWSKEDHAWKDENFAQNEWHSKENAWKEENKALDDEFKEVPDKGEESLPKTDTDADIDIKIPDIETDDKEDLDSETPNEDIPEEEIPKEEIPKPDQVLQDIYLERDYDELKKDPIQEDLKNTYIYQLPKQNLVYINRLFQRADLCEDGWQKEVEDLISVLDRQNTYYQSYGDADVKALGTIQNHVSVALKELHENVNEHTIDLVKRCYTSYEEYYFSKFDWGNAI